MSKIVKKHSWYKSPTNNGNLNFVKIINYLQNVNYFFFFKVFHLKYVLRYVQ